MKLVEYLKTYYHWPESKAIKFLSNCSQDVKDSLEHDIILLNEA